jgi:hypothetical protein
MIPQIRCSLCGFLGPNPLSVKFFLLPQRQNVNMFYIIGRTAMMGKADRLPPY